MKPGSFTILYNNTPANAEEFIVAGQTIYRIVFSDKTPPLVLTRATHHNTNRFWTSVPEGRQELAEEIGLLIGQHIMQKE